MADTQQGRKLAYSVTLWDQASFSYRTFYPGDQLPAWAEPLVRNPRAFVADDEPESLVPGRDMPIAGPSQLAHDTDPRFATKPRYSHAGDAVPKGYEIAEPVQDVIFAAPPLLHDHVASHAGQAGAEFTTSGAEETHKVRTGQVETEAARAAAAAQQRDVSDARRGELLFAEQQRQAQAQVEEQQRQQLAAAQALQSQFAESARAAAHANFEEGQQAQSAAAAEHQSGAGVVANPVLTAPLPPATKTTQFAGMMGVAPGTPTHSLDGGGSGSSGGGDKYEDMKVAELRDELDRRGLDKSGNKDELQARLREADKS
jgi:hypothetical protein